MAVIGNLAVAVTATTIGLTKGLGDASKTITGFGSSLGSIAGKVGPLAAGLAGLAGIGGFGAMTVSALGSIDATAKLADGLGTTTELMVGLQHASDLSGNSQESLQKGLQKLQKGLGAIATGGKGPTKALAMLGIEFDDIENIDTGEAFFDIADAIADMESPALKAAAAIEIFGKGGQELLPLLNEGRDGLEGMVQETKDLGISFSRIDAAKVEEANDAMTRAKASVMGLATQVAIGLSPVIKSVADGFTQIGPVVGDVFSQLSPIVMQLGNIVGSVVTSIADGFSMAFGFISDNGGATFGEIADFILDAFIVAEYAFNNIGTIGLLAWQKVQLGAVTFYEDLKHLFTSDIPALLGWLFDNWQSVFTTLGDFTATVFKNLAQNVTATLQPVQTSIAEVLLRASAAVTGTSAAELEQQIATLHEDAARAKVPFTGLTDGFQSSIKELPNLMSREMTDLEKQLQSDVNDTGASLADGLAEQVAKRREELLATGPTNTPIEGTTAAKFEGVGQADATKTGPEAALRGSAQAFSSVFAAMRGDTGKGPTEKTQREQLTEQILTRKASEKAAILAAKQKPIELVAGTV